MISPLPTSLFYLLVLDASYTERYVRCGERTGANHPPYSIYNNYSGMVTEQRTVEKVGSKSSGELTLKVNGSEVAKGMVSTASIVGQRYAAFAFSASLWVLKCALSSHSTLSVLKNVSAQALSWRRKRGWRPIPLTSMDLYTFDGIKEQVIQFVQGIQY